MGIQDAEPLDVESIREDFPILERRVGDDLPLVYLDNAATSLTPEPVVDELVRYYHECNANIHRGIHHLSQEASEAYEVAHDRLAEFIGASGGRSELVFTKNTTESENLVAYAWGLRELGPGDVVVLSAMEHHASLVTWQQIAKRAGAETRFIDVTEDGRLDMADAKATIDDDVELVSVAHVSNTLGTINPVTALTEIAHDHDALMFVDGAQAVPTQPVDVEAIDADFYAFSGHKMLGPTGIGGLYGKAHLLAEMEPFNYGGGMIEHVDWQDSSWNEVPWKFEAGTPPIAEGMALATAADYLDDLGMANVERHESRLASEAYDALDSFEDVTVWGPRDERTGLVAFSMDLPHAHDIASIFNDYGVAIRAGDHCTQPLHDRLGVAATARASFSVYNTRAEIDSLVEAIEGVREIFG